MTEQQSSQLVCDTFALNAMLRGELAAVESYSQGITKAVTSPVQVELERIRDEHQAAVCLLRHWVRDLREKPASNSGAWGIFASAVTGAAAVVGESVLLAALTRGEKHGEATYRAALGNPDFPDEFRFLVGSRLLPRCQEHLATLDRLSFVDKSETSRNPPSTMN